MKALIVGSSGFIGTNLAKKLRERGCSKVLGVDIKKPQIEGLLDKFYCLNITDKEFVDRLDDLVSEKIDYIFHLAAQTSGRVSEEDGYLDIITNCYGMSQVVKFAELKKLSQETFPKIVFASSMAVYGNGKAPFHESMCLRPISTYGVSKVFGEMLLGKYGAIGGDFLIARLFNCYGPYQDMRNEKQGMVSIFLQQFIDKGMFYVTGSTSRTRDFVFIDDVVDILTDAKFLSLNCKTLNICSGIEVPVYSLVEEIASVFGGLEKSIIVNQLGEHVGDMDRSYGDNNNLKANIGDKNFVTLSEGLKLFGEHLNGM